MKRFVFSVLFSFIAIQFCAAQTIEPQASPTEPSSEQIEQPDAQLSTPPDSPMQFFLASNGGNCPTCLWIAAEGRITPDTPQAFFSFIEGDLKDIKLALTINLNSGGGDLLASIALGQAIRQAGFNTSIAHTTVEPNIPSDQIKKTEAGLCQGACVWAFLGGTARDLDQGKLELQTYRPPLEGAGTQSGLEVDVRKQQLIDIAYITNYAHKMGFDPAIAFLNWQNADPHVFTKEDINQYRLAYNPQLFGPFSLEQKQQGLNSVAKSGDGKSTARLFCTAKKTLVIEMTQPTKESPILKDYFAEAMGNLKTANIFGLALPRENVDYMINNQQMVWLFTWPLNNKRSLDFDGNKITTSDVDGPYSKLFDFHFSDIGSLKQQLPLIVKNCL